MTNKVENTAIADGSYKTLESEKFREAQGFEKVDAIRTLTEAFNDDPMLTWLLPEKDKDQKIMTFSNFFASYLWEQPTAKVIVSKDEPALSASIWLPPGCKSVASAPKNNFGMIWYSLMVIIFFVTIKIPTTWAQWGIISGIACCLQCICAAGMIYRLMIGLSILFGGGDTPNASVTYHNWKNLSQKEL